MSTLTKHTGDISVIYWGSHLAVTAQGAGHRTFLHWARKAASRSCAACPPSACAAWSAPRNTARSRSHGVNGQIPWSQGWIDHDDHPMWFGSPKIHLSKTKEPSSHGFPSSGSWFCWALVNRQILETQGCIHGIWGWVKTLYPWWTSK